MGTSQSGHMVVPAAVARETELRTYRGPTLLSEATGVHPETKSC